MTDAKIGRYVATEFRSPLLEIFRVRRHGCTPTMPQSDANREFEQLLLTCTTFDQRPALQTWFGLLPAVRGALKTNGIAGPPASPIPTLNGSSPFATNAFGPYNLALLNFVNERWGGLVRVDPTRFPLEKLIRDLARYFPTQKISVIVPNRTRAWARSLQPAIKNLSFCDARQHDPGDARVVVATPDWLGMAGHARADLVLVVDPLFRLGPDPLVEPDAPSAPDWSRQRAALLMSRLADARGRVFGIIDRNYRPSPFEAARLFQIFGPDEIDLPSFGQVVRPVNVIWESVLGGPKIAPSDSPMRLKAEEIWNNPVLNRRGARLARALRDGDAVALAGFPHVAKHLGGGWKRNVGILVEGLTQAEQLARNLPGWPIIADNSPPASDMPPPIPGAIVTESGAKRTVNEQLDVVIRLDGGPGRPPLPANWLHTRWKGITPLHVVDFKLANHPALRKWTRSRRDVYCSLGWTDLDEDPDIAAYRKYQIRTSRVGGRDE